MKDWEISETYVLPRILCLRSGNNALLGKQTKPNLQFFSLNERSNEWATWNRSDYFYPEMIPEPDYSDSGDDVNSEEDDGPYPRSAFERLRDLTEVYVSNVDSKKVPKKADSKKIVSTPETDLKQTKGKSKDETKKPTSKAKKSPPTSPKAAKKAGSKSSSEVAKAKGSASTDTRADASPKTRSKSPPKTKSPPPASKSSKTSQPKAPPSTTKKGKTPVPETKKSSSPKTKPESRPKSPPPEPKTKTDKPTTKGKTSPKASPKAKTKGPAVAKMTKPGGDAGESSGKSSPSSTSNKKTLSPTSSVTSGEQSSDDERLIKPKKPYSGSTEMQKLHKELKFSQKYGKPGATSKTELQLALERYTENKMKRELNAEEKTSLEKILEFQAKKIEMQETMDKSPAWVDRLQKPPTAAPDPKTDEFFRVHARVVSSNILAHCFLSDDDRSECSSSRRSDSGSES